MPYCRPTDTAMENASITPARVEPCLPSLMKTSPRPSSGYEPVVRYPSAPPTVNDTVCDGRFFGNRRRTGPVTTTGTGAASAAVFTEAPAVTEASADFSPWFLFDADSGCPTLQLSR